MAEHRIVVTDEKTWPDKQATRHRIKCSGCALDVKIVGVDAADVVELVATHHDGRAD